MKFTPVDFENWPRAQMFYYFSKMAATGYSLTVEVDITKLRKTLKDKNLKFFPAYLWLVTKNLNIQNSGTAQQELYRLYFTYYPLLPVQQGYSRW